MCRCSSTCRSCSSPAFGCRGRSCAGSAWSRRSSGEVMTAQQIASRIAGLIPVDDQRPWPRYVVGADIWTAMSEALAAGGGDLLALWADPTQVHLALRAEGLANPVVLSIDLKDGRFPSVGRHHAAAIRLERAVRDLYGYVPTNAPDRRPWLDHSA